MQLGRSPARAPGARMQVPAAAPPLHRARLGPIPATRGTKKTSKIDADDDGPATRDMQKRKAKALQDALRTISAKHGTGAIFKMGDTGTRVPSTPSGCLTLDKAMGGGYPKGRIIEIFGTESSGKTTLAMHAIAEVQKAGGTAAFIDAEHALDPSYAKRLGINLEQLLVNQPDYGEQAFYIADELARSGAIDLVVVDSVSALLPRSEIDGDFGTLQVGSQARMMSSALRKLTANAGRNGCTIIFINQLRYKVGVIYGNPETTSGGNALKFYASVRLDIRSKEKITEPGKVEPVGNRVKVKVVKNKVAPPYDTAEFDIMYGAGINALGCVLDAADAVGVVERKGSYYYHEGTRLGQGREKVQAMLMATPDLLTKIEAQVREKMSEGALKPSAAASTEEEEDAYDFDQEGPEGELPPVDDQLLDELEEQL